MRALVSLAGSWLTAFSKATSDARLPFGRYWRAYGGWRAMALSPYFAGALLLSTVLWPLWWNSDDWVERALGTLPNLLGFSIGAMAIVLAFPGQRIFRHLAEDGSENSYYIGLAARLVHFILVQIAAIAVALISDAWTSVGLGFLGVLLFSYSLTTGVATALSFFGAARLYNAAAVVDDQSPPKRDSERPEH